MNSITASKIDARIAEINAYLQANPLNTVDFGSLIRHLATLPFQEEGGFNWLIAVLDYFGICEFFNKPERDYLDSILAVLLDLGILVPAHSCAARREMLRRYDCYDQCKPGEPFSDFAWYRADFTAVLAQPVVA